MIGADAIVKCLEAEGVTTVFGYPGVAICPFYNSILESDIRTILIRTEQNDAREGPESVPGPPARAPPTGSQASPLPSRTAFP